MVIMRGALRTPIAADSAINKFVSPTAPFKCYRLADLKLWPTGRQNLFNRGKTMKKVMNAGECAIF